MGQPNNPFNPLNEFDKWQYWDDHGVAPPGVTPPSSRSIFPTVGPPPAPVGGNPSPTKYDPLSPNAYGPFTPTEEFDRSPEGRAKKSLTDSFETDRLGLAEIERLVKAGLMPPDEASARLQSVSGMTKATADELAMTMKGPGQTQLSVGDIQEMLKAHQISPEDALSRIKKNGNYSSEDAQSLVNLAMKANSVNLSLSELQKAVAQKKMQPQDAINRLTQLGYSPADAKLVMDMGVSQTNLSLSEMQKAVAEHKMQSQDAIDRLTASGYTPEDAKLAMSLGATGNQSPSWRTPDGAKTAEDWRNPQSPANMPNEKVAAIGPSAQRPAAAAPHPTRVGPVSAGGGGSPSSSAELKQQFSDAFDSHVADLFHTGQLQGGPLQAKFLLDNKPMFMSRYLGHLSNGINGGTTLSNPQDFLTQSISPADVNIMYQGMQFGARQRGASSSAATTSSPSEVQ